MRTEGMIEKYCEGRIEDQKRERGEDLFSRTREAGNSTWKRRK
jgi:hypothetical protein